jgi:hypothetical protein
MAALSAPSPDIIHAALLEADQQIGDWIQAQGKGSGAAVMACLWAKDPQAWQVALVGDCKVMHMQRQAGRWYRLWASPEQTYDYAGLQPPEGVSPNSPANMIGCGLGMPALMHTLRIRDRERLVVCSDGFASQCERGALAQRVADAASPLEPGLAQADGRAKARTAALLASADDVEAQFYEALAAGGSSLRDYVQANGDLGCFQLEHRVYGRDGKPCYACGSAISITRLGQRSTFWCPRCQR